MIVTEMDTAIPLAETAHFWGRNPRRESPVRANTGFHSNLTQGITESGQSYLVKRYGEKAGGYLLGEARSIMSHMDTFRGLAREINVPVAEPFGFELEEHEEPGKVRLLEIVPFAGRDLRTVIADPAVSDEAVLGYTRDYLSLFRTVHENGYPISLDPPPANFCVNENPHNTDNPLRYIDMMPPRYQLNGQVMVSEWPEPPEESRDFIYRRYFGPEQSRVIYAQLLRAFESRPFTPAQIKQLLGEELGPQAYSLIDLSATQKSAVLADPMLYGPDVLRIIAAEGYYDGLYTTQQYNKAYQATHIHIGGILPDADELQEAVAALQFPRVSQVAPIPVFVYPLSNNGREK